MKRILIAAGLIGIFGACTAPAEDNSQNHDWMHEEMDQDMKDHDMNEDDMHNGDMHESEMHEESSSMMKEDKKHMSQATEQEEEVSEVAPPRGGGRLHFQTDPVATVERIFYLAQSGELSELASLCDPQGEHDGDTKSICGIANADKSKQAEFMNMFRDGKVSGKPLVNNGKAAVPFLFGVGATKSETMNLVQRDGMWYLMSF